MGVRYANEFLCDSGPSLWSPKGQGTFYILITSSHCLNTCGPILSKKIFVSCPLLLPPAPGWFQKVPVVLSPVTHALCKSPQDSAYC